MSTNRFLVIVIAIALAALAALTYRGGIATRAIAASNNQASMDSATRSYTGWAKAVEMNRLESATRSYTGWAKAVQCGPDLPHDPTIDSATRSYIGWARFVETGCTP